jgi:hypothetical protein
MPPRATSPVVLGERDDQPLLGAVTLETYGMMLDPLKRRILPMRLMLAGYRSRYRALSQQLSGCLDAGPGGRNSVDGKAVKASISTT